MYPVEKLQGILIKAAVPLVRDYEEIQHLQRVEMSRRERFLEISLKKCVSVLIEKLLSLYPEVSVKIDGELLVQGTSDTTLISVESLRGRKNFLRGMKDFAVCLSASEEGSKNFEIVYAPIHQMTYWGVKGEGAYSVDPFMKRRRLLVSNSSLQDEIMVEVDETLRGSYPFNTRQIGCSVLAFCYVAAGNLDGAIMSRKEHALGSRIVQEAGGVVSHKNFTVIASNEHIFNSLEKIAN